MKYTLLTVVVAVLVGVAVGFFVINGKRLPGNNTPPAVKNEISQTQVPKTNRQTEIVFPAKDAPKEVYEAFNKKIFGMSKETSTIVFTNCLPDIAVAKVRQGSSVTIKNMDAKEHSFTNLGPTSVKVPANGETKISIDGIGVYGYSCDPVPGNTTQAGIVAVVPNK